MSTYRTIFSSMILATSLGVLAAPAISAPYECAHTGDRGGSFEHHGEWMERHHKKLLEALKLSPDQELAWKKFVASEGQMPAGRAAAKSEDWSKLTSPERADRALEMMKDRQTRIGEHIVALKEFYAVLTPEQKKTFDDFHVGPQGDKHGIHGPRHFGMELAAPK